MSNNDDSIDISHITTILLSVFLSTVFETFKDLQTSVYVMAIRLSLHV